MAPGGEEYAALRSPVVGGSTRAGATIAIAAALAAFPATAAAVKLRVKCPAGEVRCVVTVVLKQAGRGSAARA
jgi:hypothetical protein